MSDYLAYLIAQREVGDLTASALSGAHRPRRHRPPPQRCPDAVRAERRREPDAAAADQA